MTDTGARSPSPADTTRCGAPSPWDPAWTCDSYPGHPSEHTITRSGANRDYSWAPRPALSDDPCRCPRSAVEPHPYDASHATYFDDTPGRVTLDHVVRLVPIPGTRDQYRVEHVQGVTDAPPFLRPLDIGLVASPDGGHYWEWEYQPQPGGAIQLPFSGSTHDQHEAVVALCGLAGLHGLVGVDVLTARRRGVLEVS